MPDQTTRAGMVAALRGMFIDGWIGLAQNGTELSGNGYARQQVNAAGWTFSESTRTAGGNTIQIGHVENNGAINFPTPTGQWLDADEIILMSASTGGNLYVRWDLDNDPDQPERDDTVQIASGALEYSLDATVA